MTKKSVTPTLVNHAPQNSLQHQIHEAMKNSTKLGFQLRTLTEKPHHFKSLQHVN
jgi:hypothetical protein